MSCSVALLCAPRGAIDIIPQGCIRDACITAEYGS